MNKRRVTTLMCLAFALGCNDATEPAEEPAAAARFAESGVEESVTGGGVFVHPVLGEVTVSVSAIRHADGSVSGQFQHRYHALDAFYRGEITCFAVDHVNHRAWIGGVVKQSNDPDPLAAVGQDIWFRVLDSDGVEGSTEVDRSTTMGFENTPGIPTSAAYCDMRIWPSDATNPNLRTWPLVSGNFTIH